MYTSARASRGVGVEAAGGDQATPGRRQEPQGRRGAERDHVLERGGRRAGGDDRGEAGRVDERRETAGVQGADHGGEAVGRGQRDHAGGVDGMQDLQPEDAVRGDRVQERPGQRGGVHAADAARSR
jgi:hypothetical protein